MAKPQTQPARFQLPDAQALPPAPGNGVAYPDRQAPAAAPEPAAHVAPKGRAGVRSYPQLGTRVPPAMYERIQRCCEETGVTQAFLVQRGLEHELTERGY